MKSLFSAGCLGLVLAAATACPAWADINDIRASDRSVEMGFGASDLNYSETVNHTTFDKEEGWVPTVALNGTWLVKSPSPTWNDMYVALATQFSVGSDGYDGGIQSCNGTRCTTQPFDSTTNNDIFQADAKIGHLFPVNQWLALVPYVSGGFRYWHRDVNGAGVVGDSIEDYETGDMMGGLMMQASPAPQLVLSVSAAGGGTIAPSMSTGGTQYNLGTSSMYEFMGKAGYTFTPTLELTGTIKYQGFGFGSSQLANGGTSYEPQSYTHQLALLAGIAYHLQ